MQKTYDDSIVIDGLNVSNWDSERALEGIYTGSVTAINATIAIFEKFHEAMDNISSWYKRLDAHADTDTTQTKTHNVVHRLRPPVLIMALCPPGGVTLQHAGIMPYGPPCGHNGVAPVRCENTIDPLRPVPKGMPGRRTLLSSAEHVTSGRQA